MHAVCCMPVSFSGSLLTAQVGSIPSQVQIWCVDFFPRFALPAFVFAALDHVLQSGCCRVPSPTLTKRRDPKHKEHQPEWFVYSVLLVGLSPLERQMKSLLYELTVVNLLPSIEQKTVFSCFHQLHTPSNAFCSKSCGFWKRSGAVNGMYCAGCQFDVCTGVSTMDPSLKCLVKVLREKKQITFPRLTYFLLL